MRDKDIFVHLFEVAKQSKDPRGVVSAALVSDDQILLSAASSDDGVRHAEDILFENARSKNISLDKSIALYATLEPCNKRSRAGMLDCVTQIIDAKIGSVVFGARDPDQSEVTRLRLKEAGVGLQQVHDSEIIRKCAQIFNESVTPEHKETDVTLKPVD